MHIISENSALGLSQNRQIRRRDDQKALQNVQIPFQGMEGTNIEG